MVKLRTNRMLMDVTPTKCQRVSAFFKPLTVEIPYQHKISLRVSSIIGHYFWKEFSIDLKFECLFRLAYEKRNKAKESKEVAAYHAFQKLKAENRQESAAVHVQQQ